MTATRQPKLKAPFPYPGGKSKVADLVWRRLGDVDNFVEPFAGSLATLLRRPAEHFRNGYRVETVNDLNHFIVNFWRAVKADPEAVAGYADSPVLEADLHARHKWLFRSGQAKEWRAKMAEDADHYDAKVAGWWVYGMCCWIGSGWCGGDRTDYTQMPAISNERDIGQGVHSGRPNLADAFDIGRGVHARGNLGSCNARREWLNDWMRRLSDRLRLVRTCYGHWNRICDSDSTMTRLGVTGVFLDPPYPANRGDTGDGAKKKSRDATLYATDKGADLDALRDEVRDWCIKWGAVKDVRVAVCGYEGDGYELLTDAHGWTCESWEANGGYANQRRGGKGKAENAKRERIWFSPNCLSESGGLFDLVEVASA